MKRSGRINPRSAKRRDPERLAREEAVRAVVFARDGGCLLREHQGEWGFCMGRLTFHHLLKAGQQGSYTEDNGVCLCVRHNDDQELDRERSRLWGLTVDRVVDAITAAARRATWIPVTARGATT